MSPLGPELGGSASTSHPRRRDPGGDPDVLIVGAGPAGSVTALLMARRGWTVRILERERFPRGKPCGECLNPGALAALRRLGLHDRVAALDPVPLRGWQLCPPGGPARFAAFPDAIGPAWAVDRMRLDQALVDAALEAGAHLEEGEQVESAEAAGTGESLPGVRVRSGRVLRARAVVGADGLHSVVGRELGAPDRRPPPVKAALSVHARGGTLTPDRGYLVLDHRRTVGVAPVAADGPLWNITVVVPRAQASTLPREPGDIVALAAHLLPDLGGARPVGPARGSGPFHRPVRRVSGPGLTLVGDAAGYFDPLTGQGVFRALRSAELAAAFLAPALGSTTGPVPALPEYARKLRRTFRGGRRVQKGVEAVVRRPRLLRTALALLDGLGLLPELVAVTGDARPVGSLLRPRVFGRRSPGRS